MNFFVNAKINSALYFYKADITDKFIKAIILIELCNNYKDLNVTDLASTMFVLVSQKAGQRILICKTYNFCTVFSNTFGEIKTKFAK